MTNTQKPWGSRETASFFHTFTDLPSLREDGATVIDHGEGPFIVDTNGNRFFEGNSGLWNMTLGFSEHRLAKVAAEQYSAFPGYHTFFGRNSKPTVELSERMLALAPVPMSRVFFTNSGSEANESVIKLLWMMWAAEGQPQRRKLLTRKNAYHGATVMASALTGKDYVKAFGLPTPDVITLDCPHAWRFAQAGESEEAFVKRLVSNLEKTILAEGPDTIAGMFAEPVMGAGGVIVPPAGYFEQVQAVLKKYQIPLVADEVICGFGRTGNLWGCQTVGLRPDIIVASKSMSAGYFPVGAVMLSAEIDRRATAASEQWEEFPHGFTTAGHPVACAVSLEAIRIITDEGILENVQKVGRKFQDGLRALADHPMVGDVRGVGLMGALEMVSDKSSKTSFSGELRVGERIAKAAREFGYIIRPLGASVVLAPPFITTSEQIDDLLTVLKRVLDSVYKDISG
ncbi:aminotransferase class III-fold pyridoxal phosphate-dependent enzyme (plasmid) [Burkholderia vietnamiensis]|uniref:Aminotransferase n=1 Tax=Burkholderia vietnamiensis (strain G4 / LMG 22486) TaxID=269482 RepID=A4JTE9_BURVG|nr:aminotransferase [Burkholderia vietnamiensis G4]MCB4350294.1 aminotransferase class III-fold pyridoxal phosphate-dependent enzyme [Burkholderia vietnamiensis]